MIDPFPYVVRQSRREYIMSQISNCLDGCFVCQHSAVSRARGILFEILNTSGILKNQNNTW